MPVLEKHITESIKHKVTLKDFSLLEFYDTNKIHFDDEFARSLGFPFRERIAHGVLPIALMSDELDLRHDNIENFLKGPFWGLTEVSLDFKAPVYIGDELIPVVRSDKGKNLFRTRN